MTGMASRSSFAGWDFDAVWQMGERHPELIIQDPMTAEMVAGRAGPHRGAGRGQRFHDAECGQRQRGGRMSAAQTGRIAGTENRFNCQ